MRTNARMNRFKLRNGSKQRATISAHLHTLTRMYAPIFCLIPLLRVVSTCAQCAVNKYASLSASRALRCVALPRGHSLPLRAPLR